MLQIVENTLKAFVSDRLFGLDAYLSRRIRHGTLSGFLLTPLTRIISPHDEVSHDSAEVHPDSVEANNALREWLDELTRALDVARRDIIQIKSETKSNGLIEATWRTTTGVALLDAAFSNIRLKVFETSGKYDFFPDIYALCWDLIERDLASVRRFLTRDFFKESAIQLNDHWERLSRDAKIVSKDKFRYTESVFRSRTLSVSSWFIRPVFRKEVYKLRTLIESMFSIIRDLEPSGVFREKIAVPDHEEINRGAFEIIGDILFILIGNAVKHGSNDSEIIVSSGKSNEESVTIALRSHVGSSLDLARAHERITEATQISGSEDIESASVTEGFSGIRKVIGLLTKIRGGKVDFRFTTYHENNSVEFEVTVPRRIILAKV